MFNLTVTCKDNTMDARSLLRKAVFVGLCVLYCITDSYGGKVLFSPEGPIPRDEEC